MIEPNYPVLNGVRTMRVEFAFTVPGQPVPKGRGRASVRGGKVHIRTPKKTASYESAVRLIAAAARPSGWPMRARYSVIVRAFRGAARSDLDNLVKAAADGLNTIAWSDDSRVYRIDAEMSDGAEYPRLDVRIVAMPVRCKLKGCGEAETFFPDEDGRCEECQSRSGARQQNEKAPRRAARTRRAA